MVVLACFPLAARAFAAEQAADVFEILIVDARAAEGAGIVAAGSPCVVAGRVAGWVAGCQVIDDAGVFAA